MSRETNKIFMMRCKIITANLLKIVRLLVEPITYLTKPNTSFEEYLSISKPTWTVTYIKPVISPSLYSFSYFIIILIFNSRSHRSIEYWQRTVESYVRNSAGRRGGINITVKMKCTASRKCLSFIYLIKGRYVLWQGTSISWRRTVEAINSK